MTGTDVRWPAAVSLLVVALLLPASVAVAQEPDRIDLPDGWRPEGVTALDGKLFVGSLATGAIWQADPSTGEGSVFIEAGAPIVALGVEAEPANGRLWVAGGPTGTVRAYDAETGRWLETYDFEAGFLNDLVATPEAIYATDSFLPQIAVVPLRAGGGLRNPRRVTTVPLSGDLVYEEGFNANGIVATPAGLIVVQSQAGGLFHLDPETGRTRAIDVGEADLTWGDGLEADGLTLYVVRNQFDTVTVLELDAAAETATLVAELTSADLDIPATAALVGDDLWAVNARFNTRATPDTEYWLTRLDAIGDAEE